MYYVVFSITFIPKMRRGKILVLISVNKYQTTYHIFIQGEEGIIQEILILQHKFSFSSFLLSFFSFFFFFFCCSFEQINRSQVICKILPYFGKKINSNQLISPVSIKHFQTLNTGSPSWGKLEWFLLLFFFFKVNVL